MSWVNRIKQSFSSSILNKKEVLLLSEVDQWISSKEYELISGSNLKEKKAYFVNDFDRLKKEVLRLSEKDVSLLSGSEGIQSNLVDRDDNDLSSDSPEVSRSYSFNDFEKGLISNKANGLVQEDIINTNIDELDTKDDTSIAQGISSKTKSSSLVAESIQTVSNLNEELGDLAEDVKSIGELKKQYSFPKNNNLDSLNELPSKSEEVEYDISKLAFGTVVKKSKEVKLSDNTERIENSKIVEKSSTNSFYGIDLSEHQQPDKKLDDASSSSDKKGGDFESVSRDIVNAKTVIKNSFKNLKDYSRDELRIHNYFRSVSDLRLVLNNLNFELNMSFKEFWDKCSLYEERFKEIVESLNDNAILNPELIDSCKELGDSFDLFFDELKVSKVDVFLKLRDVYNVLNQIVVKESDLEFDYEVCKKRYQKIKDKREEKNTELLKLEDSENFKVSNERDVLNDNKQLEEELDDEIFLHLSRLKKSISKIQDFNSSYNLLNLIKEINSLQENIPSILVEKNYSKLLTSLKDVNGSLLIGEISEDQSSLVKFSEVYKNFTSDGVIDLIRKYKEIKSFSNPEKQNKIKDQILSKREDLVYRIEHFVKQEEKLDLKLKNLQINIDKSLGIKLQNKSFFENLVKESFYLNVELSLFNQMSTNQFNS